MDKFEYMSFRFDNLKVLFTDYTIAPFASPTRLIFKHTGNRANFDDIVGKRDRNGKLVYKIIISCLAYKARFIKSCYI